MVITRILTVTLLLSSLLLIVVSGGGHVNDETEAQVYVDAHNRIRAEYLLPPVTWDNELYEASKAYAEERSGDCKMEHSNSPYGENLFWGGRDHWNPYSVVDSWASEFQFYDFVANTCTPGEMCGHFTQIIWKDTERIGCAKMKCAGEGWYFVCSYDPPGNYVDELPLGGKSPQAIEEEGQ